jgi:hypothetical protein
MIETSEMTDIPDNIWQNACFYCHCLYCLYPDKKCRIGQSMDTFKPKNGSKCSAAAIVYPYHIKYVEPVEIFLDHISLIGCYILPKAQIRHLVRSEETKILKYK